MKKYFITVILAMVCIFVLTVSVSAKEYTVASDSEYQAAYENAVDGDTIIVSQKLSADIQATKDITYILRADWESAKINVASNAEVSFVADGGSYKIMPSGYTTSGWLGITEAKENVTLNFMGINKGTVTFDGSKATSEYVSYVKVASDITWNFFSGSAIANFNPTTTSTDATACIIYASTVNMYKGSQIYANQISKAPLVKTDDFNMYGGEIFGNLLTSTSNSQWACGAIYVKNQFVMFDGKIYNNVFKAKGSSQINYIGFITTVSEKPAILLGGEVGVNYVSGSTSTEISAMFGAASNAKVYGYYTSEYTPGTRRIFTAGATELLYDEATGKTIWQVSNPTYGTVSENWLGYSWVHYKGLCDNVASFFDVEIKQIKGNTFYELDMIDLFVVGVTASNGSNVVAQRNYTYSYTGKTTLTLPSGKDAWALDVEDFCHNGSAVTLDQINQNMPIMLYASYENPLTEETGTTTCRICEKTFVCENQEHEKDVTIVYGEYTEIGTKTIRCIECNTVSTSEASPLFTCLGYSTKEYDGAGVTLGFSVNNSAISQYENETGKTITYGLFLAVEEKLGDNEIFDSEGKATSGALAAEMPRGAFIKIEIKVLGLDDYKDKLFAVGAYLVEEKDGAKKYSFLQNSAPTEGEKYYFDSYNKIVG